MDNNKIRIEEDDSEQTDSIISIDNSDLLNFSTSFDKWFYSSLTLLKKNSDLTDELEVQRTRNKTCIDKMNNLTAENEKILETLKRLNCKMYVYCDLEEQVATLRKKIETNDKKHLDALEEITQLKKSHHEKEELMRQDHENEQELFKKKFSETLENTIKHYEEVIREKDQQLEEVGEALKKQEENHRAEVTRLTMEWEEKVSKLKQRLQQQAKSDSASNQEIFRVKFLNLKQEYDAEMRRLQQVIQALEDKLRGSSDNTVVPYGRPSLKKRKL
jgi:DNA repair exonuclease SbcCD ATPase subunit